MMFPIKNLEGGFWGISISFCRQVSSSSLHYALDACEVGAQWQLALELGRCGGGAMAALVAGAGEETTKEMEVCILGVGSFH